ncbi:putative Gamma-interferon-inducible lysosomal thiol reductase [Melia azedarach]|uniref:Gamma-interferon-inducible lysosomal thiol reductase n=1 Tax=Melia azedarach TaxID=155640 RepID=A0ACC1WYV3_MELAZ|nr:putative Gamma-interferon-inducible lysosomal thiol reductase [Melia azedarach]
MISRQLFFFLFASLLLIFISRLCSSVEHDGATVFPAIKQDEKVNLSLYYETLCPGCASFISNDLGKVFQKGLINIVNLSTEKMNATSILFTPAPLDAWPEQVGLATQASMAGLIPTFHLFLTSYLNLLQKKHFKFIRCMETQALKGHILDKEKAWETCCQNQKLNAKLIHQCYDNGRGRELELQYGNETSRLNPPHEYVPWVTVNGIPLRGDFENFVKYVCEAYKGHHVPEACKSLPVPAKNNPAEMTISTTPVCYAKQASNLHITHTLKTISMAEWKSWIKKNP